VVRRSRSVWLSSLAQLPGVLAMSEDSWPRPVVSVDPADIVSVQEPDTRGRGIFVVLTTVRNLGHADVYGLQIALMAVGAAEDRPVMDRQRLVDLPAGATAVLAERVTYPSPYGVFVVQLRVSGDGGPYGQMVAWEDPWGGTAYRVLNPQAAPHGYARRIGAALCSNQCRGY
jgi:hypothetical protein